MSDIVWTRQRLVECPVDELPPRFHPYRKKKKQTWESWRQEIIMRIDNGTIDLSPRKKKSTKKTEYDKRQKETLEALSSFGIKDEAVLRFCADPNYDDSYMRNLNVKSWQHQNDVEPCGQGGMWHLRMGMERTVRASIELKLEEANCDLMCVHCPAGSVLGCVTQNVTSIETEGINLKPILGLTQEN